MSDPRIYEANTRGRPFQHGNPGRPRGSRNKATIAAEALLDGEAEELTRKAIEMAKSGDTVALRLCLERLVPARKDTPVCFSLPTLETPADAVKALSAILEAVANGDLTPLEAGELAKLIGTFTEVVKAHDLAARVEKLEATSK